MGVPDLLDYGDQVAFLRRQIREKRCARAGTWQHGVRHGDLWHGQVGGFHFWFETEGRDLVAGSFRAEARGDRSGQAANTA